MISIDHYITCQDVLEKRNDIFICLREDSLTKRLLLLVITKILFLKSRCYNIHIGYNTIVFQPYLNYNIDSSKF